MVFFFFFFLSFEIGLDLYLTGLENLLGNAILTGFFCNLLGVVCGLWRMVKFGNVSKNRQCWLFSPDGREYSFVETGLKPVSTKELEGQRESCLPIEPILSLLAILDKKKLFKSEEFDRLIFY
jgi:hypothetical protein